jgi:hypothetical protein
MWNLESGILNLESGIWNPAQPATFPTLQMYPPSFLSAVLVAEWRGLSAVSLADDLTILMSY